MRPSSISLQRSVWQSTQFGSSGQAGEVRGGRSCEIWPKEKERRAGTSAGRVKVSMWGGEQLVS